MDIKINPEPVAIIDFDLKGFKEDFVKDFDLEKASRNNMVFEKNQMSEKEIIDYLLYYYNWHQLFLLLNKTEKEQTVFTIYGCVTNELVKYQPKQMDTNTNVLTVEKIEQTKNMFLILDTFEPLLDPHIENMLGKNIIDGTDHEWAPIFKKNDDNKE